MRLRWLCLVLTTSLASAGLPVHAAEPYLEFLSALRERQYYDYALLYLDQIESDPNMPAEVRDVLQYERAMTLLANSRISRSAETQIKQLDQAEALLEQFMSAQKDHPLAAQAATERAQIHLGKARVAVNEAKSPSNAGKKAELLQQARSHVGKARGIFQTAHDKHKKNYDSFPHYINEDQDPEAFAKRAEAEINYIKAQLDLALCTYEEAQTYDVEAPEYKKLLTDASLAFEKIHQKYRSQVAGLYARMWQGKCFEEQEDLGKALGIYNELLRHPGNSDALRRLQEQVFQFQLICYNHPQRKEYQLIIDKAEPWLNANRRGARTPVGLGIRWELARALEQRGLDRTLPEGDRNRLLRRALEHAQTINAFQSQYKDVSTFMVQRLKGLLDLGNGDPQDFAGAIGLANHMVKEIGAMNTEIDAARKAKKPRAEIAKLETARTDHLKEAARILKLALSLATDETEITQINRARHLLAFVYYSGDKNYESAVLGEFVGRRYQTSDPQMALDSAYIAMAAWQKAYFDIPKGESRDFEMQKIVDVCNLITTRWPESDRANDARMNLGRVYSQRKQPAEAAQWYSQVPETAPTYTEAQVAAGQAYWTAYLDAVGLPDEEKPKQEEFDAWQAAAETHLKNGIAKLQTQVPEKGTPPDELIAAKVSLAQIQINKGLYAPTISLLTGEPADAKGARDPHPVMAAIKVEDETQRPDTGVKSRDFAALAYQLLLRCYVGTQQIDKALATMTTLESIAGGAQGEGVMQIYVQLGRELEKEIARLRDEGNTKRLGEVLTSFDQFLNELYKRKDQMSLNSLVWIGETYYGLAMGMEGDKQAAEEYFKKASTTYEDIVKLGEDPEKVPPDRLTGIKLRLVNCKRHQGDFETAAQLASDILKASPRALDAQFEAAYVLQDWGASGQADSHQFYLAAINGAEEGPLKDLVWGWAYTSNLLQQIVQAGRSQASYLEKMHEARHNSVWSRLQYAKAQSSTPRRQEELEKAKTELEAFISIAGEIDDAWWEKYDALYRDIQKEAGTTPVVPLERPEVILVSAPSEPAAETAAAEDVTPATAPVTAPAAAAPAAPSSSSSLLFGLVLLVGVAVVGGIMFVSMNSQKKRRQSRYATAGAPAAAGSPAAKRPAAGAKPWLSAARGSRATKVAGNGNGETAANGGVKPAAKPKPAPPRPPAST